MVAKESNNNPTESTVIKRRMPACTPIITPATPMLAAAIMDESAITARVVSSP